MVTVAINGFGRIGRTVLRAWLQGGWPDIEIVAVNDIASAADCSYLFEYDSVFGPFKGGVELTDTGMIVAGRPLRLTHAADLSQIDLSDIDIVMECTGRADTPAIARRGLQAGARRILISGPSDAAEVTLVLGANEDALMSHHQLISNASCTTNALAPLAKLLDDCWGIATGFMTTVHCYTGSQPTTDSPRGDPARSRAAALSMVPTTTSAQHLVGHVLPQLQGRLMGAAVRVPTASVSAVDLSVMLDRPATPAQVNDALRNAGGVIGWTNRPLVSTDLRARPESIVMALPETQMTEGGMLRVFGWYDNEWGFSCRMLDMALRISRP
ncbi:type I glyceraldehyde-3-phosphate dehydrogenase [Roseinatronobacter alkalisoli]|uniref:Glyceraldehyde 3-phosphate dehydrogenase NAD-binding domain-containing protein n=1 Tax=Roseinatronobacter alkalisoli TaxID=3028235 RepID=A0ABT5TCH8_9RHOB|nr:glyceraldehyde 3-phosphate dehydrogenase NAD-binding domain-containing protein [Roseinatronobacter sp. HJB301]MDD7972664.1 glyceraldehyde 3-phosphate dehydrogenase NAD-binding domain-containing protein [Roseinatronobacter sp. HJB301]